MACRTIHQLVPWVFPNRFSRPSILTSQVSRRKLHLERCIHEVWVFDSHWSVSSVPNERFPPNFWTRLDPAFQMYPRWFTCWICCLGTVVQCRRESVLWHVSRCQAASEAMFTVEKGGATTLIEEHCYGGFYKCGVPQNGWLTIKNPIKMDENWGVPPFEETSISELSPHDDMWSVWAFDTPTIHPCLWLRPAKTLVDQSLKRMIPVGQLNGELNGRMKSPTIQMSFLLWWIYFTTSSHFASINPY